MQHSPAVVQQVLREDGNVNMLPEHRTQHGGRAVDTGSQLVEEHHRDYDIVIIIKDDKHDHHNGDISVNT